MAREFKVAISLPNGTMANPALTFASDDNTGVYRDGADVLGFAVGGAAKLIVNGSGIYVPGEVYAIDNVLAEDDVVHKHGTARQTSMMDLEVLRWM